MCTGGRAGVLYVITKFFLMDSLPNFLTHGAPLRALRARESFAINVFLKSLLFTELCTSSAVFINYYAFQKHANSDVQNPTAPFAFFAAVNILSGPLRKQNFTLTGSKGHGKVIP